MTIVRRIRLLTAVLGVAAASAVVGTTVFGDIRGGRTSPDAQPNLHRGSRDQVVADFGRTKFSDLPAVTYKHKSGATVFAWQVKPTLPAAPARTRDVLVMVDTSASQAGTPLQRARHIIDGLAQAAGAGDTISVWTVNLNDEKATRSLTGGFKPANSDAVRGAAASLVDTEYAAGATDLAAGLEKALASFDADPARQQVILFLGDGESAASPAPLTEAARVDLGGKMEQKGVAFFAVPLGIKVNAQNLHGFAALTGGTLVRVTDDVATAKGRGEAAGKLRAAFDVPVLRPDKVTYGPEVAEVFPTKLPPLRADRPTLVVGTLKADAASVTARIEGRLADGSGHATTLAERLPASEPDNYFLHAMLEQWRTAANKDAPAILQADRALALGSQQFRLFREEFLSQAVYAISSDRLDHAQKLYEAALKIDPASQEAEAGVKVLEKMRTGVLTRDKLRAGLNGKAARANLNVLAQVEPKQPAPPAGGTAQGGENRLQQAQAERQVQEGQFRVLVDDTIRRARQLVNADPDTAYEDLKRQRDIVLANPALGDAFRSRLVADLEQMMQTVATKGAVVKRDLAAERERIARTRLRINEFERQQTLEEQTQARVDAFKQLMNQARFELAQQEAQVLIQERISQGGRFSAFPEAVAAYMIGQAATNLREHRELVRIREDRYLLTMMQVEKSFIPYPDEPPVHFPPAAVWRELTSQRVERYSSSSLGADIPPSMRRIQSIIDGPTAQRVRIEAELDTLPLRDVIQQLEKEHDLKIIVLEDAFRAAGEAAILDKKPTVKQRLTGLTVGAFLEIVLQSVGATYVVRPEYIEVTTIDKRLEEKVVRAFDVTELALQIPSSVNQATLMQNFQLLGANLALFGQATFAGGFGAVGGLGLGGFGALGGGLGAGGLGAGALGGGLGAGGAAGAAGGAGVLGAAGQGQQLGAGGGVAGFGGGQLGQFGNLGGQFGIQGNDASPYLLTLITEVVARGEWANVNSQFLFNQQPGGAAPEEQPKILPENQLNSIGFYPPARALIIRGTGKYHPQSSVKLKKPEMGAAGGPGNPARMRDAQAQARPNNPPAAGNGGQAVARAETKPRLNNPHEDAREFVRDLKADRTKPVPVRMWQEAMDRGKLTDPGLVVACADFLFEGDEPKSKEYAAEILKAGIRRGLTDDVWAHEALALALKESKAGTDEVKRVAMSAIDLEPTEAKGYLKAAKAADEIGQTDLALAFCQRAATLEPNVPLAYANALVYAEKATEAKSDVVHWASENLLRRDWTSDGVDYHTEAKARLDRIVKKYEAAGQQGQVDRLKKTLDQEKHRDLVIELLWQGSADLDLIVAEPTGSVATATGKRTTAGGVLKGDLLEAGADRAEVYTAAQAFSGTYKVSAKVALGRAIGGKATVKVTKFAGTDRQTFEIYSIDLGSPQPVEVRLDGGSRAELAVLPTEETKDWAMMEGVPEVSNNGTTGMVGGTGTATGVLASTGSGTGNSNMPAVVAPQETRLAGIVPTAPGMRAVRTLSPDRKTITTKVNPVFGGLATDLPMPKVSLLPGSDGR